MDKYKQHISNTNPKTMGRNSFKDQNIIPGSTLEGAYMGHFGGSYDLAVGLSYLFLSILGNNAFQWRML